MNKNELFETVITDISDQGQGIGRVGGMAVFVKGAAVGDRLRIKITKVCKNHAFAVTDGVIAPSPRRTENDCAAFPLCGGCALRNIEYPFELELKSAAVRETMRRIGGVDIPPRDIVSCRPDGYRNKAQFPVGEEGAGFYAVHSHRIIACDNCRLIPPEFSRAAKAFSAFIKEKGVSVYNEHTRQGLVRHLFLRRGAVSGEAQAAVVINGNKFPLEKELVKVFYTVFGEDLKSVVLNINKKDGNVILGDKNITLYGDPYITDLLCGVRVRLSVNSFYQVNHAAAEKLYRIAADYAAPENKTVLDLYCGAGTIGLSMANRAKEIIGVEIVPAAVEDAKQNAISNGIKNARFICADAATAAKELESQGAPPDVVILDPPRKGCDAALLETVANGFCPERIVYVSCDKGTLARDVKILSSLGYNVKEYTPVDMFPRTAHCEVVALLARPLASI